jgi:hypothetical protein
VDVKIQSPYDQGPKRKKRKKRKKKAKKKVRRKAKKAKTRRKVKKKVRRRGRGDRILVSGAEFSKIRKTVARPRWMDLLEEGKRKTFTHDGRTYWPVFSLLYAVDAVEIVPLKSWKKPTYKAANGFRAGVVKKIGSSKYVFVRRAQFIRRGSPLDV